MKGDCRIIRIGNTNRISHGFQQAIALMVTCLWAVAGIASPVQTTTITNSDGGLVTVQLSGAGTLSVTLVNTNQGPINQILLQNTDGTSALTIKVKKSHTGNGQITINSISGNGSLKNLIAKSADLVGSGINLGGFIRILTIGNLTSSAITLGGAGVATNALTLGSFTAGVIDDSSIDVTGNVGKVTLGQMIDSELFAGFTPSSSSNPMGGGSFGNGYQILSVTVKGSTNAAFADSTIAAQTIGTVTLRSVNTNNNGVAFGILVNTGVESVTVKVPKFAFDRSGPSNQTLQDFEVLEVMPQIVTNRSRIFPIAGGANHSIALKSDGTVWDWGFNGNGQLGDDTTTRSEVPVQVVGLTRITAIAGGANHSIALKSDGTVWDWGFNGDGQLGNDTTTGSEVPVQVVGLTRITAIAGGANHSIALKSDGTVWDWGFNGDGQLGNDTTTGSTLPVQVVGLTGITAIAGGTNHTVALKSDGTVWDWGFNGDGQLGNDTTTGSTLPVQVVGLTGITAIAGGANHSIALKSDGTVWDWGFNGNGQLGNGTTSGSTLPVQVVGLTGITAIAGGANHSIALKSDGTVWDWGFNGNGQLGNGTTTGSTLPIQVVGLTGITAIAGGANHSIALKSDGTVWDWGFNGNGQLGNGTTTGSTLPVQVVDLDLTGH